MNDYIKSYQTTGKSPQAIPQEPFDLAERARLGLPPLFEPYSEIGGVATPLDPQLLKRIHTVDYDEEPPSADLTAIPEVQMFSRTSLAGDNGTAVEHLQSITTERQYSAFSFEVRHC